MKGPNFLGIGVQRSGTSWLSKMMKKHPEVFVAPPKELHFFDRFYTKTPNRLNYENFARKFLNKNTRRYHMIGLLAGIKSFLIGDMEKFLWRMKFHLNTKPTLKWYLSLFETNNNYKAKGEITPAYAILDTEAIQEISKINHNMKIIIILRNPIYRAWSFIRYEHTLGHLDLNDNQSIDRIIYSDMFAHRNNYSEIINRWKKFFPEKNFHVTFFDDIIEYPKDVLQNIFSFINVDPFHFNYNIVDEKIGKSKQVEMPQEIKKKLISTLHTEMKTLAEMFHGRPKEWYNSINF